MKFRFFPQAWTLMRGLGLARHATDKDVQVGRTVVTCRVSPFLPVSNLWAPPRIAVVGTALGLV